MKRILLSMAIVAVAASCSQNEVFDIAQTNGIGFSTLNDRATKAANDVTADYQVYALVTGGTGWFIDDVVVGSTDAATDGPYYWPTADNEKVNFYAYAPAEATLGEDAVTDYDSNVTFTYAVPSGAQEDFTVASPLKDYTSTHGTADFTFAHMLSKVTIIVELDDSENSTNLETNYDLVDAWTADVSVFETTSSVDVTAGTSTAKVSDPLPTDPGTTYGDKRVYYITPQVTEGCIIQLKNIQIKHTVSGSYLYGSSTEGVDLQPITLAATAMDGDDFAQGKHYVITITVGGKAETDDDVTPVVILFSATDADWDAEESSDLVEEGLSQDDDQEDGTV